MADDHLYGQGFVDYLAEGARRSADHVALILKEIFAPSSMVDIGGGAGHWAAAFRAMGVTDVLTIDGPWVPEISRVVPPEHFLEHDLAKPLTLERSFDIALSLEAAEHLSAEAAARLVRTLTEAAPVVIFSAALPGQGGVGHINEQRASYWASLFAQHDYACFTDLRSRTWHDDAVEVWYRQNMLCFVRRSELHRWAHCLTEQREPGDPLLDVAHPDFVLIRRNYCEELEASAARLKQENERLRRRLETTVTSRAWRKVQDTVHRLYPALKGRSRKVFRGSRPT